MIGEGVLIFHATAVLPIWSELTLQTDGSYPFARNIVIEQDPALTRPWKRAPILSAANEVLRICQESFRRRDGGRIPIY